MSKKRASEEDVLRQLEALDEDVLASDYPLEAVHEELRAEGFDPGAIASAAVNLVRSEDKRRRLAWQQEARARIERTERVVSKRRRADMPRVEMLAVLEAGSAAGFARAFRKREAGSTTDGELRELIEEMDLLEALEAAQADEGAGNE